MSTTPIIRSVAVTLAIFASAAQIFAQQTPSSSPTKEPEKIYAQQPATQDPPPSATKDHETTVVVVKKGDTLASIARANGASLGQVIKLNKDISPDGPLYEGVKVTVPVGGNVAPVVPPPQSELVDGPKQEPKPKTAKRVRKTQSSYPVPPPAYETQAVRSSDQDEPVVLREMKSVREIVYSPDVVPELNCGQFMVTTIILPSTEQIVNVQAGDIDLW